MMHVIGDTETIADDPLPVRSEQEDAISCNGGLFSGERSTMAEIRPVGPDQFSLDFNRIKKYYCHLLLTDPAYIGATPL